MRGTAAVLSREIVWDVLSTLQNKTMTVMRYTAKDMIDKKTLVAMPIIEITEAPRSFKILRQFVDLCFQRGNKSPVVQAIEESWHRETPKQRLLLGTALRHGPDFAPHILEVITTKPTTATMCVPNPDAGDSLAMGIFMEMQTPLPEVKGAEQQAKRPRLSVRSDLEDVFFLRYMDRLGVPGDDPTVEIAFPSNFRNVPMRRNPLDACPYPIKYLEEARMNVFMETAPDLDLPGLESLHSGIRHIAVLPCDRESIILDIEEDRIKPEQLPTTLSVAYAKKL